MSTTQPGATIVVPVLDEEHSVGPLLDRLQAAFSGRPVQVVFVDDSHNTRTGEAVQRARVRHVEHLLVHHIHRTGPARRGGLAGAVIDGIDAAQSDVILVMDGDGQHPAETAPQLLDRLHAGNDIVVASRYIEGGSNDGLDGFRRRLVSRAATVLTRVLFPRGLRGVTDPMTGFFAFKRSEIDLESMRADVDGFKILFELLTRHPNISRSEVPLQFQERTDGESKSGDGNGMAFIKQLLRLRMQTLPTFVNFAIGGLSFAVVGMLMLAGLIAIGVEPHVANATQLVVTFVLNFLYNRHVTWRGRHGRRLRWQMVAFGVTRGTTLALSWASFVGLMAFGASHNLLSTAWRAQVANVITLAGAFLLNYLTSKFIVFRKADTSNVTRHKARSPWLGFLAVILPLAGVMTALAGLVGLQVFAVGLVVTYALFGFITSALEVNWRLYGRRTPEARMDMKFPLVRNTFRTGMYAYSIIVPALREAAVIGATLRRLLDQTYPDVQIVVTLAEGDDDTIAAVQRCIKKDDLYGRITLVVEPYSKSSKPQQLNVALKYCTGEIVGVVDAETLVSTELIAHVDAKFRESNADVVQGGVQLMNLDLPQPASWERFQNYPYLGYLLARFFAGLWLKLRGWFAVHNVLEYYFWFSSRMMYQVDQGFVPLGGNTVFIRRELLEKVGGWPLNLTEDCALGVHLSVMHNAKVVAAYEARLASYEETPERMFGKGGLIKQRTRWDQGFWSVLMSGEWLKLPTLHKRVMALYILAMPLIQAVNGVMLPMAVVGVLTLTAPAGLVLVMFTPLVPMAVTVVIQVVGLREFSREFKVKTKPRHYASLVLLNLLYQAMLALPALVAIYRHLTGKTNWQKTDHAGAHLVAMETKPRQLANASR